ncbi:MAG: hypothetical protein KC619_35525, partial [Myxococcales bacterium]|nr:hypothetical protein [Myxococcales bacterium]
MAFRWLGRAWVALVLVVAGCSGETMIDDDGGLDAGTGTDAAVSDGGSAPGAGRLAGDVGDAG